MNYGHIISHRAPRRTAWRLAVRRTGIPLVALLALIATACSPAASTGSTAPAPNPPAAAAANPTTPPASPAARPAPTAAPTATTANLTLQVKNDPKLGSILVDNQGRTVYTYDPDDKGVSNCYDRCAQNWPPVLLPSGDPKGPATLQGEVETLTRKDGGRQVMYNDQPLYLYIADKSPGDVTGDGVGGVWHVVKPAQSSGY